MNWNRNIAEFLIILDYLPFSACNILAVGTMPFYSISNYGAKRNCTLTAIQLSVVTIRAINIGPGHEGVNYDVS